MFNNFPENRAVYEIIWKNMVEPDRSHMTIKHGGEKMQEHRHTLIIFNSYFFSAAAIVTVTRFGVGLYVHCLVLLIVSHVLSLDKLTCHVSRLDGDCSAGLVFVVSVSICTSVKFFPCEGFSWFYWRRFCMRNLEHSTFFLISNFRRVPNDEFFLLDDFPAS